MTKTMSVRFPDETKARLEQAAEASHISANAAVVQAVEQWAAQQTRAALVAEAADEVFARRAGLFKRLADA
ncbi:ribbon-helix-helix domain-containing protein [Nocardia sp. NBC_01503]|uniref:hypothetical protein n=1 Tax=unclassified Nocardia TaxID=2637762 RepID=UPI002E7B2AE2|nr:hypothetical protein [Nocardia sp. NBC_01503]WTL34556.1 ribbon-helix-helix domain-containing protein [Nocardia sp. NBC_01503]